MKPQDRYEMLIRWSNEDEAFIAHFPELPYAEGRGNTRREALVSAEEAFSALVESQTGEQHATPLRNPQNPLPNAEIGGATASDANTLKKDREDASEIGVDLDRLGDL